MTTKILAILFFFFCMNIRADYKLPPKIEEIVVMSELGVSTNILNKFIQKSQFKYNLTARDIIIMKKRAVGDSVILTMLNHAPKNIDPESYEFFYKYYLLPRTIGKK